MDADGVLSATEIARTQAGDWLVTVGPLVRPYDMLQVGAEGELVHYLGPLHGIEAASVKKLRALSNVEGAERERIQAVAIDVLLDCVAPQVKNGYLQLQLDTGIWHV